MDNLIPVYQELFNLKQAKFVRIDHEDAMVAVVYKITQPTAAPLILKICERVNDYAREMYFLNHFSDQLPVPRIVQAVHPEDGIPGAILMECLHGTLIKEADFTNALAYEVGSLLARIHLNRVPLYGDLTQPESLSLDPRVYVTMKFEEGLAECKDHLPAALLERCRLYYDTHVNLLTLVDGPCITHRDFRAGNVMVYNGKIQGIIDWSSARASFAEEDFCTLEHKGWPLNSHNKSSFLAGYASIRPIPDYASMMVLLRLSRAIATIGFLVKRGTWDKETRLYHYNRQFLETL